MLIAFLLKIQLQVLHKQACAMLQGRWVGFVSSVAKSDDTKLSLTYWSVEADAKRTGAHPRPSSSAAAQKGAAKPAQVDICIEANKQLMVRFVPPVIDETSAASADFALPPVIVDIEAVMELVLSVHVRSRSQSATLRCYSIANGCKPK
jgi:hypothetical protein